MTEESEKLKSLIRFHSANKIDNYNRGGQKKKKKEKWGRRWARKSKKKSKRIYRTSQNKNNKFFLELFLSESFLSLGVTVHISSLGCPPIVCWSLDLLWGQLRF